MHSRSHVRPYRVQPRALHPSRRLSTPGAGCIKVGRKPGLYVGRSRADVLYGWTACKEVSVPKFHLGILSDIMDPYIYGREPENRFSIIIRRK